MEDMQVVQEAVFGSVVAPFVFSIDPEKKTK